MKPAYSLKSKKAIRDKREAVKRVFIETFDDLSVIQLSKDLHVSRQALHKWKKEDNWLRDKEVYWSTIQNAESVNQKTTQLYINYNNKHLEEDTELLILLKNELKRLISKPNKSPRTLSYIVKAFTELRNLEISIFGKPNPEIESATEYIAEWTGKTDGDANNND